MVEDSPSDLKLLSEILTKAGHRVRPASDGELALRSARAKAPDLILLDVQLPGIDGIEVCRRLKDDPATRELPVVFISAHGVIERKVKALEVGGADFITKPFESAEVVARVNTHLNLHRAQRELLATSEALRNTGAQLQERVKELSCLYGIDRLAEDNGTGLDSILQGVVGLLPGSWRCQEMTCARIEYRGQEYLSDTFAESPHVQSAQIAVDGDTVGRVQVFCKGSPPPDSGTPFQAEEKALIDAVAMRLGRIAERQLAVERSLQRSEGRFRLAFDNAVDAIFWVAVDSGQIVNCNKAAEVLLEKSRSEIIGHPQTSLHPPDETARYVELFERQLSSSRTVTEPAEVVTGSGRRVSVEISSATTLIGDQELLQSIFRDVSQRQQLQEQLLHAQKMEAMGTLAGGVAHDMNNVLAVVIGLGTVLEAEMGPKDAKLQDINKIVSAARRGRALVENLLGFARKGKYHKQIVSLNATVDEVAQILNQSLPKKVVINRILAGELSNIECDAVQIMQALMNLCLNANDALDGAGTITIATSNEVLGTGAVADLEAGNYVKLQVTDDGSGMDEQTCHKAFEPFFTTKALGRGTGLGLSMVFGVVENHGGAIVLDSAPGRGTAVNIWLPAVDAQVVQEARGAQRAPQVGLAEPEAKILLVDDEAMIRVAGTRMLEVIGYDVIVADSGSSALDLYRKNANDIDLVILDLSMPVMDGAECFEKLKEIDPDARVLICTGHGKSEDTDQVLSKGALGVVRKPLSLEELSELLAAVFRDANAGNDSG